MANPHLDTIIKERVVGAFAKYLQRYAVRDAFKELQQGPEQHEDDVERTNELIIRGKVDDILRSGKAILNSATREYLPIASRCLTQEDEARFNRAVLEPFVLYAENSAVTDALRSNGDRHNLSALRQLELSSDLVILVEQKCVDFRRGVECSLDSTMAIYFFFNRGQTSQWSGQRIPPGNNRGQGRLRSGTEAAERHGPIHGSNVVPQSDSSQDVEVHSHRQTARLAIELESPQTVERFEPSIADLPTLHNWIHEPCVKKNRGQLRTTFQEDWNECRERVGRYTLISSGVKTIWTRLRGFEEKFPVVFHISKQDFGGDITVGSILKGQLSSFTAHLRGLASSPTESRVNPNQSWLDVASNSSSSF